MTDDKFRKPIDAASRLAELRGESEDTLEIAEELEAEEVVAGKKEPFSNLSADRMHKVMLELRFKGGNAKALAYSYLVEIDFNPSKEIVLDFTAYEVRLVGRNLHSLFSGLTAQRVAFVQETDDYYAEATLDDAEPVITQIKVLKT